MKLLTDETTGNPSGADVVSYSGHFLSRQRGSQENHRNSGQDIETPVFAVVE